jgi:hypothetical protein
MGDRQGREQIHRSADHLAGEKAYPFQQNERDEGVERHERRLLRDDVGDLLPITPTFDDGEHADRRGADRVQLV